MHVFKLDNIRHGRIVENNENLWILSCTALTKIFASSKMGVILYKVKPFTVSLSPHERLEVQPSISSTRTVSKSLAFEGQQIFNAKLH